jgi:hypothetical protein
MEWCMFWYGDNLYCLYDTGTERSGIIRHNANHPNRNKRIMWHLKRRFIHRSTNN